jgi:hypothetical protein
MPYCIDLPINRKLDKPVDSIIGWIADKRPIQEVLFRLGEQPIEYVAVDRPDVQKAYPHQHVLGFSIQVDFVRQVPIRGPLILEAVRLGSQILMSVSFNVENNMRAACDEFAKLRAVNCEWCLEHLQCPHCLSAEVWMLEGVLVCKECQTRFAQKTGALNLLTPHLYHQYLLKRSDAVSSHGYDRQAFQMINEVSAHGGKILDCGAGSRRARHPAVINLEIVDYPSTDILGVAQALPFRDEVFDAIFSLSVLEHVSDPFGCAREMIRVLKPGGRIYACVPFLQPEHGYPSHFYNMSRQGLSNLFRGLEIEQHSVPRSVGRREKAQARPHKSLFQEPVSVSFE